jgi:uncharacterized protein (TIGR02453 family)
MGQRYVTKAALDFLQDLDLHNERAWFKQHQSDYESLLREPLRQFIDDVEPAIHRRVSKHIVCDSRKVGGSLFRIQRDTRFAHDKAPYKTNSGVAFRHEAGKEVTAPTLYFNVEPGNCFFGVGVYRPPGDALRRMRQAMVDDPSRWTKARDTVVARKWDHHGDQLKRAPQGFDADHPLIDDLRRTSHAFTHGVTEREVTSTKLLDLFVERCAETLPVLRWQAKAIGVPF